jgi:hypothetical protein
MDKRTDAINTFIEHRCNFVVGEMSNTWMDLVGATPELANNAECKALVPLIEDALVGPRFPVDFRSFPC